MIGRLLCLLAFHRLRTIDEVGCLEFVACERDRCGREWAVWNERHLVSELSEAAL